MLATIPTAIPVVFKKLIVLYSMVAAKTLNFSNIKNQAYTEDAEIICLAKNQYLE